MAYLARGLAAWDEQYGVSVQDATGDSVSLEFEALPEDYGRFLEGVVELCPDVCDGEQELLVELRKSKTLYLWWD